MLDWCVDAVEKKFCVMSESHFRLAPTSDFLQCLHKAGVLKVFESRSIFSLPPTLRGPQDYYTE